MVKKIGWLLLAGLLLGCQSQPAKVNQSMAVQQQSPLIQVPVKQTDSRLQQRTDTEEVPIQTDTIWMYIYPETAAESGYQISFPIEQ